MTNKSDQSSVSRTPIGQVSKAATEAPQEIAGRNRLVLKAKNSQELKYYTTDNE